MYIFRCSCIYIYYSNLCIDRKKKKRIKGSFLRLEENGENVRISQRYTIIRTERKGITYSKRILSELHYIASYIITYIHTHTRIYTYY